MYPYFKLFNETIYSYPLMMGIAWGVSFNLFQHILKKFSIDFKSSKIFFIGVFIFAWIGAKVFFIITSQGLSNTDFVTSSNFWLGGGFVFYGGLIFGLLFLIAYQNIYKNSFESYSALIPPLAVGHGIGRIGCYLAGCCFGSIIDGSGAGHEGARYPVQLFESISLFFIAAVTLYLLKTKRNVIGFYFLAYGFIRFILEYYRGDDIRGLWIFGLSTSQIISIILILVGIGLYIYRDVVRRRSKSLI